MFIESEDHCIFTQHDPQFPWSRISRIVGQFDHFFLESNSSGIASRFTTCSIGSSV